MRSVRGHFCKASRSMALIDEMSSIVKLICLFNNHTHELEFILLIVPLYVVTLGLRIYLALLSPRWSN
jgi:hypothetical protein